MISFWGILQSSKCIGKIFVIISTKNRDWKSILLLRYFLHMIVSRVLNYNNVFIIWSRLLLVLRYYCIKNYDIEKCVYYFEYFSQINKCLKFDINNIR